MSSSSPALEALALGALEPELEGFAAAATSAEAALRFARFLASRLRDLPATGEAVDEDTEARWRAVREDDAVGRVELVCWRDAGSPALLRAVWQDGALELVRVHVGDRAWESRPGPGGDAIFDSDPTRDDAASRARADAFPERLREERRRWEEATSDRRRRCRQCVWEAEEGETVCVICGAPLVAGASGAEAELPTPARGGAPLVPAPSTNVLELPEAFARALDELQTRTTQPGGPETGSNGGEGERHATSSAATTAAGQEADVDRSGALSSVPTFLSWTGWALGALGLFFMSIHLGFIPTIVFVGWDAATLLLVVGTFLLGLSSSQKRSARVPWVALAVAVAWACLGFVFVVGEDVDLGELWWLPQVLLPSGLANLAGVVVGIGANALRGRTADRVG